ncbi:MAG: helix-turn-helix transcriptional regulator [Colwellia sp.]|nr:helix-turn-helix transcriptional regulator [Colwellia sp.]
MPARHYFPAHKHRWHQLLYATSGVLIVDVIGERLFIPPENAVWLPCGCQHSVSTEYGAELKSLYIDDKYQQLPTDKSLVLKISPLLKALIIEVSTFDVEYPLLGYEEEVISLMLSTLPRLKRVTEHLPWPTSLELLNMCSQLYQRPGGKQTTLMLAKNLAMSKRTLERRFHRETGMTIQAWSLRLRFLKAIELLTAGHSITNISLDLGYSSPSPFIYMFRNISGMSPGEYIASLANKKAK